MIITIDGPAGTGKTTVARAVAQQLHFSYFDTGAMYRAFTWACLQKQVDLYDLQAVKKLLVEFDFKIIEENDRKRYFLGLEDVTESIRSRLVTGHVSAVAAIKEVRDALLPIQHRFGTSRNAVFEGRDLGTVVFPDAEVKIFLTADPYVRAERRMGELSMKSSGTASLLTQEELLAEMIRRDRDDSTREIAPLRCPQDAFEIDTTHLTIEEVVAAIVRHVRNCL